MRKALNGQGTTRRRPDGTWEGRLRKDGKRISVYGKTADEARIKLNAKINDADRGIREPTAPGRLTVAEFLDQWLEATKLAARLRASSWARYETLVRTQLKPGLGQIRLVKLDHEDLEAFYGKLLRPAPGRKPYSIFYVRRIHGVLATALRWARRKRLIATDPAELVDRFPHSANNHRGLTVDELLTILDLLEGDPSRAFPLVEESLARSHQAFLTTALLTGLRFGELAALRWSDLDQEEGTIKVERALTRLSGRYVRELGAESVKLGDPKTESSLRVVPMLDEVKEILTSNRTQQRSRFLAYGRLAEWSENELIFLNQRFQPYAQNHTNKRWHRIQTRAGIPPERQVRLHDTRRTMATLLATAGRMREAQQWLGHEAAEMTLHYMDRQDLKPVARQIENSLAAARAKRGIQEEAR